MRASVVSIAHQIGIRESRHLVGDHVLTLDEMIARTAYPDTIAMGGYRTDIHYREEQVDASKRRIPKTTYFPDGYFIPYRRLLPRQVENLLVAGRCISTTQEANGSTRVMGCCMALGQAAGVAAALSAEAGASPREVDIAAVQDTLRRLGGILD